MIPSEAGVVDDLHAARNPARHPIPPTSRNMHVSKGELCCGDPHCYICSRRGHRGWWDPLRHCDTRNLLSNEVSKASEIASRPNSY